MAQPTVRIEHDGFPDGVLINAADFDPAKHRPFGAPVQQAPAAEGGDPKPAPHAARRRKGR